MRLSDRAAPRVSHVVEKIKQMSGAARGHEPERQGHTRLRSERLHAAKGARPDFGVRRRHAAVNSLENATAHGSHDADQRLHLVPCGKARCDGSAIRGQVMLDTRRREANGTSTQRFAELTLHQAQVLRRGLLLKSPLPHGPRSERGMPDIRRKVDALVESLDRVEVLGKRLETPVDALGQRSWIDVFCSFEVPDDKSPLVGPYRGQRKSAVAHHCRRHPVPTRTATRGIPEDLGVHMRVPIDETRRHDPAFGVDLDATTLGDPAHRRNSISSHANIGSVGPKPRTVDDGSASDHDVVGHQTPLTFASNGRILGVMGSSAAIHARLSRPVIDIDGHMAEHLPTLAPYLEREGLSLDHPSLFRLIPPYGGTDRTWHEQTPLERSSTRTPRGPWWSAPAGRTLDLATALFPELLYERLDELGIDFGVVYPSLGLVFLHTSDSQYRRGTCRALNRANAETFANFSDRLTPVAAIPMHTPEEAVAELDYAVNHLGFKAVLCAGYVQRPFDALADKDPETSRYAFWLDQFGIDSPYDYDPVWAKAEELGVSIAFHSGFIGMTPYRSISSYVANHISMLATGQQSLAKSSVLGRRHPHDSLR